MASLILVTLWQRVGFDMLIYLAGLQGVDPQLTEAATVDGATGWQRFRQITLPLLGTVDVLPAGHEHDLLLPGLRHGLGDDPGGPDYSTTTVVTYAYRTAFDEHGPQELGYGAAVGVVIYLSSPCSSPTCSGGRAATATSRAEEDRMAAIDRCSRTGDAPTACTAASATAAAATSSSAWSPAIVITLVMFFPLYWMFVTALSPRGRPLHSRASTCGRTTSRSTTSR